MVLLILIRFMHLPWFYKHWTHRCCVLRTINDVGVTINEGHIIEQYPDDYPFPSYLILGMSSGKIIHVVASIDDGVMYIITAYTPDPNKWEDDWKTRKEVQ